MYGAAKMSISTTDLLTLQVKSIFVIYFYDPPIRLGGRLAMLSHLRAYNKIGNSHSLFLILPILELYL